MSSVAYVVTKDVRHIASWTQDRESTADYYRTGVYRPICGGKVRGWKWSLYPDFRYEDEAWAERQMRKPLCRYCVKTLADLNAIGGA